MNYEKKYKEALERMKSWAKGEHPECFSEAQKAAEFIFPELKESKDERIVRCLLNYFNHVRYNGLDLKGTDVNEVIAWLEKQGEKKPTDKVEPKFKDGDWIVFNGRTLYIKEVAKGVYRPISKDGIVSTNYDWDIDNAARLWTIQDAKDGDVLVTSPKKGSESNEQIFLFKAINSRDYVDDCIEYYFRLCDGVFYKNTIGYMGTILDTFYPATKEQRDTLFAKMKEAGYEWDNEKKELKEIV